MPVCFPQFAERGPLPKHGFVRNLPWRLLEARDEGDGARLTLGLQAFAQGVQDPGLPGRAGAAARENESGVGGHVPMVATLDRLGSARLG